MQPVTQATQPIQPPALTEDEALLSVSAALRRVGLLKRPDPCYAYRYDPSPGKPWAVVDVRENHAHPECGGDPGTQPHLFFVRVQKQTRALAEDAATPSQFQPLKP